MSLSTHLCTGVGRPERLLAAAAAPVAMAPLRPRAAFLAAAQQHRWMPQGCGGPGLSQSRMTAAAAASSSEDRPMPDQPLAADDPMVEVERQSERALAYGAAAMLLGGAGLALALAPGQAVEYLWGACPTLLVAGLARSFGAMLLLAAVAANCLKEAAEKDLLRSDTYKRLNLGLLWWGVGTALALWLAPQQPLRYALGLCTALLAATSAHAALTFHETSERGEGFNPLFLARQSLVSLGSLGSYSSGKDTALLAFYGYGLAAKAAVAAAVALLFREKLRAAVDGLVLAPAGTLGTSLLPVIGVGFTLVALVLLTLKDAAKRGRLGASTFKALNIGVAVVSMTHALTLWSWVQAGVLLQSKLVVSVASKHAFVAGLGLYQYAFAKKKKGH